MIRIENGTSFSVHDIRLLTLIPALGYHLSIVTCDNVEIYNIVIRGAFLGGLDGIDIGGENIWVHDVEVSNKDGCVIVKVRHTSQNILRLF